MAVLVGVFRIDEFYSAEWYSRTSSFILGVLMLLENQVALITGSGPGIGRAIESRVLEKRSRGVPPAPLRAKGPKVPHCAPRTGHTKLVKTPLPPLKRKTLLK